MSTGRMRVRDILFDYTTIRQLEVAWVVANTIWRFFVPPIWVLAIYLLYLPLWTALTLRTIGNFFLTLRLLPFVSLGVGIMLLPFQESQVEFLQILDTVTDSADEIWNYIFQPSVNDDFHCGYPICQIWNVFWDLIFLPLRLGIYLLRDYIVDHLKNDIEAFLILTGIPPATASQLAQETMDFLDIQKCSAEVTNNCTGPFYTQWIDESPGDFLASIDLFWPPNKKREDSWNGDGNQQSTWIEEDEMWRQATFYDHSGFLEDWNRRKNELLSGNGQRMFLNTDRDVPLNSTLFLLFQGGPNGYNTVVLGFLCAEFEYLSEEIFYVVMYAIDFIGRVTSDTQLQLLTHAYDLLAEGNPSRYFWVLIDLLWELLLNIPCINFETEETFFVSISNCTCKSIVEYIDTLPGPFDNFVFVPAKHYKDLPSQLICCLGFCCITNNQMGHFPHSEAQFFDNFWNQCLKDATTAVSDTVSATTSLASDIASLTSSSRMLKKEDEYKGGDPTTNYGEHGGGFGFPIGYENSELSGSISSVGGGMAINDLTTEGSTVGGISGNTYKERVKMEGGFGYRPPAKLEQVQERQKKQRYQEKQKSQQRLLLKAKMLEEMTDKLEQKLYTHGYPVWMQDAVFNYLGANPKLMAEVMREDVKFNDPYENPWEYFRDALMDKGVDTIRKRLDSILQKPSNPLKHFKMAIQRGFRAIFEIIDSNLANFGPTKAIPMALLDPTVYGHEKTFLRSIEDVNIPLQHWLLRYATMHPIENERSVRQQQVNYITETYGNGTMIELTDGQLALRATYMLTIDMLNVIDSVSWLSDVAEFNTPSYRDIGSFLIGDARLDITMRDLTKYWFRFFEHYNNERVPRWDRPGIVVETEVLWKTFLRRVLIPEKLEDLEDQMTMYGGRYAEAAFRHTRPARLAYDNEIQHFREKQESSRVPFYIDRLEHMHALRQTAKAQGLYEQYQELYEQSIEETGINLSMGANNVVPIEDLTPTSHYNVPVQKLGQPLNQVQMNEVFERLRLVIRTSSWRHYLIWNEDRKIRQQKVIRDRKRSYDFQRRLAAYIGDEQLVRLDPSLPLPGDPLAPITEETAEKYYIEDNMIHFHRNESWVTRAFNRIYNKVSSPIASSSRGVDPAIVQIFANMEKRNEPRGFSSYHHGITWSNMGIVLNNPHQIIRGATRSAMNPRENWDMTMRDLVQQSSRLPVLSSISTFLTITFGVLKQWRWFVAAAVPFMSAPEFRNSMHILGSPYLIILANIYQEGLGPTFSQQALEEFGTNIFNSLWETLFYLANVGIRFVLCNIIPIIIDTMVGFFQTMAAFTGGVFGIILTAAVRAVTASGVVLSPIFGYCPPVIQLDSDGIPVFKPWNYLLAILDCDPQQACTDETDCPGMAPCRCALPDGNYTAQYTAYFWGLNGDFNHNCPNDIGLCLCWPRLPCTFEIGKSNFSKPFDKTCSERFNYRVKTIVWYQHPSFWQWLTATIQNTFISIQFITRSFVRGWQPFIPETVVLAAGLFLIGVAFALQRYVWMVVLALILLLFVYGSVLVTSFTEDQLIPALERISDQVKIISWLSNFLLEFLRFSNYSKSNPIGSQSSGEFVCFMANTATLFVGLFALSIIVPGAIGALTSGWLRATLVALLFVLLYVPRRIWDTFCCIANLVTFPNEAEGEDDLADVGYGDTTGQGQDSEFLDSTYETNDNDGSGLLGRGDNPYLDSTVPMGFGNPMPPIGQPIDHSEYQIILMEEGGGQKATPRRLRHRYADSSYPFENTSDYFPPPSSPHITTNKRLKRRRRRRRRRRIGDVYTSLTDTRQKLRDMVTAQYWKDVAINTKDRAVNTMTQYAIHTGKRFAQSRAMSVNAWQLPSYSNIMWNYK